MLLPTTTMLTSESAPKVRLRGGFSDREAEERVRTLARIVLALVVVAVLAPLVAVAAPPPPVGYPGAGH